MAYKENDIVLVQTRSASIIKPFHVRLLKKTVTKETKGNTFTWPGYTGWDAELVYPEEAATLRKKWSIPFMFPDHIKTFVFEEEIIKKVRKRKKKSSS